MKVLILPDSFKNCLSSVEVGKALSEGVKRVFVDAEIEQFPVADGGEGTVEAFVAATHGRKVACKSHDPLGRAINAFYGVLPNGVAVIEMASASGIELLSKSELNPIKTSTFGTGELIKDAILNGAKSIILGLGGSATNDGGTGMAKALGFRFLDKKNREIPEGGGNLGLLSRIDRAGALPDLKTVRFRIACDVQNPLTGENGASAVYGPQKGATPEMVRSLDLNLTHLANIITRDLGISVKHILGAGAAGGMGAGAVAFLKGGLLPGFGIVQDVLGLEGKVAAADIVLTGEGKIDEQTLSGKTPFSVAQLALKHNKPVIAFAGTLGEGYQELYQHGFTSVIPITEGPTNLADSMAKAPLLLSNAAERIFRVLK